MKGSPTIIRKYDRMDGRYYNIVKCDICGWMTDRWDTSLKALEHYKRVHMGNCPGKETRYRINHEPGIRS